MRIFGGIFALLLQMLALPSVAKAPIIVVNPFTGFVIMAGPNNCPFDIALVPQPGRPNNGKVIIFADGSTISHGAVFVIATNVSTSKSINLNISGPGHFSVTNNTFTSLGPTLVSDFPPNTLPPNLPPVAFAHGQTEVQFDNLGNLVSVTFSGTAENLCELLQ